MLRYSGSGFSSAGPVPDGVAWRQLLGRALLMQNAGELSMGRNTLGFGLLFQPKPLMASCLTNCLRPIQIQGFGSCVRQSGISLLNKNWTLFHQFAM